MNNFKSLRGFVIFAALSVSGCQQYLERTDRVTLGAGNSLAANEARMVVDPWPRNVDDTHIHADGQRMSDTIRKYKGYHATEAPASGNTIELVLPTQ